MQWSISPKDLHEKMKSDHASLVIVDVREPEELVEGAIQPSLLIPLGELSVRADAELSRDSEIVIYCAHGIRSLQAVGMLKALGYKKLLSLHGGFEAWKETLLPY